MSSKIQGKCESNDSKLNCVRKRGGGGGNGAIRTEDVSLRNTDIESSALAYDSEENAYWEAQRIQDEIDEMNDRNQEMDEMFER